MTIAALALPCRARRSGWHGQKKTPYVSAAQGPNPLGDFVAKDQTGATGRGRTRRKVKSEEEERGEKRKISGPGTGVRESRLLSLSLSLSRSSLSRGGMRRRRQRRQTDALVSFGEKLRYSYSNTAGRPTTHLAAARKITVNLPCKLQIIQVSVFGFLPYDTYYDTSPCVIRGSIGNEATVIINNTRFWRASRRCTTRTM